MTSTGNTSSWNNYNGHALNGYNNNVGFVSTYVEILDDEGNPTGCFRPIVNSQDLEQMSIELQCGYGCKSFVSYDMFFRPVSMDGDECGEGQCFPKFTKPTEDTSCSVWVGMVMPNPDDPDENIHTLGQEIPITQTLECIDWEDLNPIQNPAGGEYDHIASNRSGTPNIGHDFEMLTRCGTGEYGTPEGGMLMVPASDDALKSDYADDYRFMAWKGPIIITGWGYTCDGYPVPNQVDVPEDMADGTFVFDDTRSKQNFADGHLRNPFSWITAPLDLRYDYKKNVWTTAGCAEYMGDQAMVCVELCDDVTTSTPLADGLVCDGTEFTQNDGTPIANPIIQFEPKVNMKKGTKVTLIKSYDCYEQLCTPVQREEGTCPTWSSSDLCVIEEAAGDISDACNITLGKNLSIDASSISGDEQETGSVLISAGLCFSNSEDCFDCAQLGTNANPLVEEKTYCKLDFGRGMCAITDPDDETCVKVNTQIHYTVTNDCVTVDTQTQENEPPGQFCDIEWGKGLGAEMENDDMPDEEDYRKLKVSLAWDMTGDDFCVVHDSDSVPYNRVNCINWGGGLSKDYNPAMASNDCNILNIGVGIETSKDATCVFQIPEENYGELNRRWCALKLGANLQGEVSADGVLTVSSGFEITNCDDEMATPIAVHRIKVPEEKYTETILNTQNNNCRELDLCDLAADVDCEALAEEFGVNTQPDGDYVLVISKLASQINCTSCRLIKCEADPAPIFTPPGNG